MLNDIKKAARNITFDDIIGGASLFVALCVGLFWAGVML